MILEKKKFPHVLMWDDCKSKLQTYNPPSCCLPFKARRSTKMSIKIN